MLVLQKQTLAGRSLTFWYVLHFLLKYPRISSTRASECILKTETEEHFLWICPSEDPVTCDFFFIRSVGEKICISFGPKQSGWLHDPPDRRRWLVQRVTHEAVTCAALSLIRPCTDLHYMRRLYLFYKEFCGGCGWRVLYRNYKSCNISMKQKWQIVVLGCHKWWRWYQNEGAASAHYTYQL